MKILLVTATQNEIAPFLNKIGWKNVQSTFDHSHHQLSLLVTGVGMVATAFAMGRKLINEQFDLVLNLGIAGAFDRSLNLGEVVLVESDQFSEFGAEDGENFKDIHELGLAETNHFLFKIAKNHELLKEINTELKSVKGITVNTVHGNERSIDSIRERLNPQVESMEGAAFYYGCKRFEINGFQLRAISNYVEKRKRDEWKIDLAINNLADRTIAILNKI